MQIYALETYAASEGADQTAQMHSLIDCANAQSDLGLHCPLIEALDTVEHIVV